jgi:hypothetical protein
MIGGGAFAAAIATGEHPAERKSAQRRSAVPPAAVFF